MCHMSSSLAQCYKSRHLSGSYREKAVKLPRIYNMLLYFPLASVDQLRQSAGRQSLLKYGRTDRFFCPI